MSASVTWTWTRPPGAVHPAWAATLDLRHLETFLAVVEHRGFRRAAAQLFVSQPAVSSHIAELERTVGAVLFIRGRQGVALTPVGEALVGPAQRIVGEAREMRRLAQLARHQGELTVGMMPGGAAELTMPLFSELAARLPGVQLHLRPLTMAELAPDVLDRVDLLLGREPFPVSGADETVVLVEEVYAGVPATFEAAEAESLTVEQAVELTFVHFGEAMPEALVDYWSLATLANGWRPRERGPEVFGPVDIRDSVEAGHGIGIAPACITRAFATPGIRYVPLVDMPASRVKLMSRPGAGELVAAVHHEAADIAARLTPLLFGAERANLQSSIAAGLWY